MMMRVTITKMFAAQVSILLLSVKRKCPCNLKVHNLMLKNAHLRSLLIIKLKWPFIIVTQFFSFLILFLPHLDSY